MAAHHIGTCRCGRPMRVSLHLGVTAEYEATMYCVECRMREQVIARHVSALVDGLPAPGAGLAPGAAP